MGNVKTDDFWAVFNSAPDAYLLLAPDPPHFTMVAANDARLRVTMTRREDVEGRPLFEVFPDNPDDPEASGVRNLLASLNQVLRTRKSHRMPLQKYDIRTPDGKFEERYWDTLNTPVFDDEDNLIYIIHRVEDVTNRVETERMLAQESAARARYRLLTDMIPQLVWTTDANGYHRYFSRRWHEFTGTTLDDAEGSGWMNYLHPDDRDRMLTRWQHSLDTGEPYSIEYRVRGADGKYRWFLGQAVPLRNEAGEIIEWFGTLTDIEDRKRLERERDQLLESVTDAFFAVDGDWRLTYTNQEAIRLLKRSRDEIIGRKLWDVFAHASDTIFQHEYERAVKEQKAVQFEAFAPVSGIWVDVRAYPNGTGLSVFFHDITKRKQAEQRLRESEEQFRTLGNTIPQLAWMADSTGSIFWYNDRWLDYTGCTLREMAGWGWRKVHHPEHVDRVVKKIRHSFETGEPWEDTFPLRGKDGEYRWFLSRALPIRDANGDIVTWFGTNTDITEELDARNEAERRREELEQVTESRTRLMRGFTHDVKNPLGAADGYAQLLEDGILGDLSEKQLESVHRIRKSLQTSLHLINELLELARAEAGQIEVERESVDVAELARESAEDFRAQANASDLEFEIDITTSLPAVTDPTRVRQILSNLLSNAVKYTPAGRIRVTADHRRKEPQSNENCIAISVDDTGPGIPPDKREVIFQEFSRLDPEAEQGAGIGLAISRRIARILGGDITVESEMNQGSSFTLWLPAAS